MLGLEKHRVAATHTSPPTYWVLGSPGRAMQHTEQHQERLISMPWCLKIPWSRCEHDECQHLARRRHLLKQLPLATVAGRNVIVLAANLTCRLQPVARIRFANASYCIIPSTLLLKGGPAHDAGATRSLYAASRSCGEVPRMRVRTALQEASL